MVGVTERIKVYTDGACSGNPGPGGWAWIVPDGRFGSGPAPDTTNQRMELQAVLDAVQNLTGPLEIVSDSTYVVKCFNDGWWKGWLTRGWTNSQKKPVANRDIWEPLIALYQERDLTFTWVKGHAGNEWNEYADRLAVEAGYLQAVRRGGETPTSIQGPPPRGSRPSTPAPQGVVLKDPTGRDAPVGHKLVILGLRPRELGGYEPNETRDAVRRFLTKAIRAKAEMFPNLVVLSGMRLGSEILGAEAALAAGVPLVAVLPYPDPHLVWPTEAQEFYHTLIRRSQEVIVLQKKDPDSVVNARGALGRRDSWFSRNSDEAIIIWDNMDKEVDRTIKSLGKAIGEGEIWVVDPAQLPRA